MIKLLLVKRQIKQILESIKKIEDNNVFGIELESELGGFANFRIKGGLDKNPEIRYFMIKDLK